MLLVYVFFFLLAGFFLTLPNESIKTSPFSARGNFMIAHPEIFYDHSLITKLNIGNEMQSCFNPLGGLFFKL